ncbi:MAG TPA: bacteriohemerythrin [Oligoflexus sp.]|uniref:bacteriohemerythrin n=1 Tax=Oligoflexus sp. TaxID=1971216 RepID=UPI002D7F0FC5|nr:bacteriohemerythrin [Oligoflexus sp.]HET9239641.1 bacteriohemerythrin [Oligoflexus sp.]
MAWYEWNKSLDIHVTEMNDEHKVLIDLMNRLHDEAAASKPKDILQLTFQELVTYTRRHFQDEENYMYSINYPGLPTHRLIHAKLLTQLDGHYEAFVNGDGTVSVALFDFLKMWLNAHIRGIDIQYGEHGQSVRRTA